MLKFIAISTFFILFMFMTIPTFAATGVQTLSLEKSFYTNVESIKFIGTENDEGTSMVTVVIYNPTGKNVGLLSAFSIDGTFETVPSKVDNIFSSQGIYEAIGFTINQQVSDGFILRLEYDGNKVTKLPEYSLTLNDIAHKTIAEGKTLSFTASVTDSSLDELTFSLDGGVPSGAEIGSSTGQFTWTPTSTQGNVQGAEYAFG